MKPTPPWVTLLAVLVQFAGLGLCVWAMESTMKRDREIKGSTKGPDPLGAGPGTA